MTCKHRKLVYIGMQETVDPYKQLCLYNCLDCYSTISRGVYVSPTKKEQVDDLIKKKMIGELINVLNNHITELYKK